MSTVTKSEPKISAQSQRKAAAVTAAYGKLVELIVAVCESLLDDGFTRKTLNGALYELFSDRTDVKYNTVYATARRKGFIHRNRAANTKAARGQFPNTREYLSAIRKAIATVNAEYSEDFTFDVTVEMIKGRKVVVTIK